MTRLFLVIINIFVFKVKLKVLQYDEDMDRKSQEYKRYNVFDMIKENTRQTYSFGSLLFKIEI